jgi:hypothetical protein
VENLVTQKTEFQRFVEKIKPPKDPVRDCWEWVGRKQLQGYGRLRVNGKKQYAHRYSFDISPRGPITPGLQIDHLCRNPSCVNPNHLEQVTSRENTSRGLRGALCARRSSRFIGVTWSKRRRKWLAKATSNGKKKHLGTFDNEEDAAKAYRDFVDGLASLR